MDHEQRMDGEADRPRPIRSLVTCLRCGCRLRREDSVAGIAEWYHFSPLGGRDARGCLIDCADVAHDALGAPIAVFA